MSKLRTRNGSCLCGTVQLIAQAVNKDVGACHCDMCRKWGGGPFIAADCGTDVSFNGEENITVFNSSKWAERGFCKQCGTHLFYRLKENQQYIIPVGVLEDEESFVFSHQIFIDQKPSYYTFSNKTENMTAEEVFAKYEPSAD